MPQTWMKSGRRSAGVLSAAVMVCASVIAGVAPGSAGAATPERSSHTKIGSIPRIPPGAHADGAVPESTPVHLVVTLEPRDPVALRNAVNQVSDPSSMLYRQFLSTGDFGRRFGATDADVEKVRNGLAKLGLKPGPTAANRLSIPLDTTAARVAASLHAPLHAFRAADGTEGYANTEEPTLPTDLADSVQGIFGLDTLPVAKPGGVRAAESRVRPDATQRPSTGAGALDQRGLPVACDDAATAATNYGGATPADYLSAYSASSLVSAGNAGGGQNVAILSLQALNTSEINVYRQCFGTTGAVHNILVDGGADPSDDTDEATLDVETILGLAPKADISFYQAPNNGIGWYDNIARIVGDNSANTVSVSWGMCEPDLANAGGPIGIDYLVDAEANLFAQAAMQGQTFFASSGDSGSAACYNAKDPNTSLAVNDPASQPFVTAVGGTSLATTTAPPTETVWHNSYGASGGGVSNFWRTPPYQPATAEGYDRFGSVCGNPGGYCRTVPDVAASADPETNGFVVYSGGQWIPYGGTSVAAPQWAALTADMGSSCPGTPRFGQLNYTLYDMPPSAFNDVTVGNNDFAGTNGGKYAAKAGYDLATGLGTPVISNMTSTLCAYTPTLDANQSFVLAAYADFTGEIPFNAQSDPLDRWVAKLDAGRPRSDLATALANSSAWVAHIVTSFYENTLGRAPDAGGLAHWEQMIETRQRTVAQVAAYFYASSEYFHRGGSNATTWVNDLYAKLLGRTPDPSGVHYWVAQTSAKGRTWVAYQFYQSAESCRARVTYLYDRLLRRPVDQAGLAFWAGKIKAAGDVSLAVNLASGSEYYHKAAVRFPGP